MAKRPGTSEEGGIDYTMAKFRLRYKGVFDWEGLYKTMREWFKEREYDFLETRYKHKMRSGGLAELEINWKCWREETEYVKNWITVYFHIWDFKEVDVIKNGKKMKLSKARMLIEIEPWIEIDYEGRWAGSLLKRKLRDFYNRFLYRVEIESLWEDKLWYNSNKLLQLAKRYLEIESESEAFDDYW